MHVYAHGKPELVSDAEFVLLMHRNEVFKPTNTGRLIADVFINTHVFCWSRTDPDLDLVKILNDDSRECLIVFPADATETSTPSRKVFAEIPTTNKKITFILLDGTWKQSGRMFHLSQWLKNVSCISLQDKMLRGYAVRKSHDENYVSTAEAAALCLKMIGEDKNSETLLHYFQLFNEHYLATRGCYPPVLHDLHQKLAAQKILIK